jgi:hypothetical protein
MNCPKCVSPLRQAEFLISEDQVKTGLECSNVHCDFMVCEMLGEYLFEDYNDEMYGNII